MIPKFRRTYSKKQKIGKKKNNSAYWGDTARYT
jgi:hypothetical protein